MPLFIKTEHFTKQALELTPEKRRGYIKQHKLWVQYLEDNGQNIFSGYLTNEAGEPGGGGVMVFEAISFKEAKNLINKDPMILNNLVNWELNKWVPVSGKLSTKVNEGKSS